MNLTSTYTKSFTFYGLDENDEFNSITFCMNRYYCTMKNKTGIYIFDMVFRFVERISLDEYFDLIYFDKYNQRFFLTKVGSSYELYQYNIDFKLIQRSQLRSNKDYGPIKSIQVVSNSSRLYITTEQMIGFCYLNNPFIQEFKSYEEKIQASFIHSFNDTAYVSVIILTNNAYMNELLDYTGSVLESKQLPILAKIPLLKIYEDTDIQPPQFKLIETIATNLYQVSILETTEQYETEFTEPTFKEVVEPLYDDSTDVEDTLHAAEFKATPLTHPKSSTSEYSADDNEEEYLNGEDYIDVNSIHLQSGEVDEFADLGYEGDRNLESLDLEDK